MADLTTDPEIAKDIRKELIKKSSNHVMKQSVSSLFPEDESETLLKDKNYFNILVEEIGKKVVGEETAIATILLVCLGGSLTENAAPTSSNLMINAKSGTGKDHVVKGIMSLLPHDKVITRQRISPTTLTYFKNEKTDPNWSWDEKVLYLEDISNDVLNNPVFVVMSSNRNPTTTVTIKNKAEDIKIKGKPTIIITTASPNPKQDLLRRYPIITLDEGIEQSVAIMEHQAKMAMEGINPEYNSSIRLSLNQLEKVSVKIPFACKLTRILNAHHVIIRTNNQRLLDYIMYSATIHQHQRKRDSHGFIITERQDYEIGGKAFLSTMSNKFSIPLTNNQKKILEIIAKLTKGQRKEKNLEAHQQKIEQYPKFSLAELEPHINFISDKQLRRELKKLTELEFLEMEVREREGFQKNIMVWSYRDIEKFELPEWELIEKG